VCLKEMGLEVAVFGKHRRRGEGHLLILTRAVPADVAILPR
jgi:hypothetical protein